MKFVNPRRLNTAAGVPITALAMPAGTPVYSEPINASHNVGFFTALLNESHAGASGSLNIYPQYSVDGVNWYEMYTSAGGVLTKDDYIATNFSNAINYVMFVARPAQLMRLAFSPTTDSVMTCDFGFQDEL